jgi:hypothetical protein
MLLTAMLLLAIGAAACSIGLLELQAAQLQADHAIGPTANRAAATRTILDWSRVWLWTGVVAIVAGLTALVVALRRQRGQIACGRDGHIER